MTPVVSYWGAGENMLWMDAGPCDADNASACVDSVSFDHFVVENLGMGWDGAASTSSTTTTTTSPTKLTTSLAISLVAPQPSSALSLRAANMSRSESAPSSVETSLTLKK